MSNKKRVRRSAEFKFQVALEAAKGLKTLNEIATEYQISPNQTSQWKRELLANGVAVFHNNQARQEAEQARRETELYEQIGRLKMEVEWLKKKLLTDVAEKRLLVEPGHPELSIRRQCELLGLNRSSYYYEPTSESEENLAVMREIDRLYTQHPFLGYRVMTAMVRRAIPDVNKKRVQRLMRKMGLRAIYPQKKTSQPHPQHRVYPYLLRDLIIDRPNQVWCADITYVPMRRGFMYLVAIMDWHSRYILTWELSNSLDRFFCLTALDQALTLARPEIFNTDQGAQFTANDFTGRLLAQDIRISMDGRGRAFDNIFIERFWRTLKYQHIYLHDYETVVALWQGLRQYIQMYNEERPHQALKYQTPAEVYYGQMLVLSP
ncbi:MAG: IS3 family transposase [Candidatus Promineifilaceae bacterium]